MATRGRPKMGEKPMTSSERRMLWVKRMRNDDGSSPGQPRRTSVEIYLSEEAREVLRKERQLAKECELPPRLDSELVEQLLIWHSANSDRENRAGLSLDEMLKRFRKVDAQRIAAREDFVRRHEEKPPLRNARTLERISEMLEKRPQARVTAQEAKRCNNTAGADTFGKLAKELRPLFEFPMEDSELNTKLRRKIDEHIERIFQNG